MYIVYMGDRLKDISVAESHHLGILQQVVGSKAEESWVHSYKRALNGFVVMLSEEEMKKISSMKEVVSVFPNRMYELHTTASWDFMGFPTTVKRATTESNIIVGMLDTGIWPESKSFSDKGFGSPPSKWKGTCQGSNNFTCTNKIIGARYYHTGSGHNIKAVDISSPRDTEGHGTHTSSTAAGREVKGASFYGLGSGIARGAVPSSRIAVYKICWSFGCAAADILAAFDDAIADGVDIISLSVGSSFAFDYFSDPIAIGSFHAMKNGILTSNSAGNNGPSASSVTNISPWSLTVAASNIDRRFVAQLKLGNDKIYEGNAINAFDLSNTTLQPLVYGGDIPNKAGGYNGDSSRYCYPNSLDRKLVKKKIVLCDTLNDASGPLLAGALGTIMQTTGYNDYAFSYPLPTTVLGLQDANNVSAYINSTSKPVANILKSEGIKDPTAPTVVSFSSRGPNPITKDILKPDLTAPGVDILAAWSPLGAPSVDSGDTREVPYNIISGTSMSCPHATGAAAYVKSFNPTLSPAAIKSALMTTANPLNVSSNSEAEFAYGAGHINPVKAANPGLVYDAYEEDYIKLLCGLGYSDSNIKLITGENNTCTSSTNGTVWDLNYPSFALSITSGKAFVRNFSRTVTNVGTPSSTYNATLSAPSDLQVSVTPSSLSFKSLQEKQSFVVTVKGVTTANMLSASLVWDDGVHQVRSPIVVFLS